MYPTVTSVNVGQSITCRFLISILVLLCNNDCERQYLFFTLKLDALSSKGLYIVAQHAKISVPDCPYIKNNYSNL